MLPTVYVFAFCDKQNNFPTNFPSQNNLCVMEQDSKISSLPHPLPHDEKSKVWVTVVQNNSVSWLRMRLYIWLVFLSTPRRPLNATRVTNKFQFARLVCEHLPFDSWSLCNLFVNNLNWRSTSTYIRMWCKEKQSRPEFWGRWKVEWHKGQSSSLLLNRACL